MVGLLRIFLGNIEIVLQLFQLAIQERAEIKADEILSNLM